MPQRLTPRHRKARNKFYIESLENRVLLSGSGDQTFHTGHSHTVLRNATLAALGSSSTVTATATSSAATASGSAGANPAAATVTYNRAAAVAYANANYNKVVADGYFWINGSTATYYGAGAAVPVNVSGEAGGIGDDCAHFVSSCIGSPGGGLTIPSRAGTYGEPGAARLDELLVGNSAGGYGTTYEYGTLVSSVSQLTPGDVIGYDWDGSGGGSMSGIDHTVVYIGNGEVDCHATSHLAANWTLGGADDYFFIHITLPDTSVPVAPANSSPAKNATGLSTTPKLTAGAFSDAAPGSTQAAAEWQVYKGSTLVYDSGTDTTDLTSITVPSGKLSGGVAYTWKVRYEDSYTGWSSYSTATGFTTTSTTPPNTPANSSPVNNATVTTTTPTLTASAFSDGNVGATQAAAEWQVYSGSTVVYDSGTDATHLTSITVPSGKLNGATAYTWQVRYEDNSGLWSNYSTATTFTVATQGPVIASLTLSPSNGSVTQGYNAIIVANGVSDVSSTVANVQYYLENGLQAGLQTSGPNADTLEQTITDGTNGYIAYIGTSKLALGAQKFYVIANDNLGAVSTPLTANFTVIPAVSALTATASGGRTAVIGWANTTTDATGYVLERSANGGAYVEIDDPAYTDTSFIDTGLTPNTSYTYRFSSTGNNGTSTYVKSFAMTTWIPGDANGDGKVDFNDFLIFQNNVGKPGGWQQGDFDGDGVIDFNDFLILQNAMAGG